MKPGTKAIISVVLVGAVAGIFALQVNNDSLYQGKIFDSPEQENSPDLSSIDSNELPDLVPMATVMPPEEGNEDIQVKITIKNDGKGAINGENPFAYTIYLNDINIFSNSDTYSSIDPGDSFEFTYPISKQIYNYGDNGVIKVVLDENNLVEEKNEENNEAVAEFNF